MNGITVSGKDCIECHIFILSHPSFDEMRLKFRESGFFYAGFYCASITSC